MSVKAKANDYPNSFSIKDSYLIISWLNIDSYPYLIENDSYQNDSFKNDSYPYNSYSKAFITEMTHNKSDKLVTYSHL